MKISTMKSSLVLTALLLSAVVGQAQAAEPEVPVRLSYTGCSEQTALLIVPAVLMPKLPAGFIYTTPLGDNLLAAIHVSGSHCLPVGGQVPEEELFAFALVKAPAEYMVPEIATYAIALGGYSNRASTVATFEAWGIPNLIELASVEVGSTSLPLSLARIGKVKVANATSKLSTQMTAVGPVSDFGAGRSRAFYIVDGQLLASFDATYTNQQGQYATGTVVQTGDGPLPVGIYGAVGSHAFGYDLTVGDVQYY